MYLHGLSVLYLKLTHSHTVAFSRKHNEDSSGLQLLQVITLHDLYSKAKYKFQFKFWWIFFNLFTNPKRLIILPWNSSVSGQTIIQALSLTFCSASSPYTHWGWVSLLSCSRHVQTCNAPTQRTAKHVWCKQLHKGNSIAVSHGVILFELMNSFIIFLNIFGNNSVQKYCTV